MGNVIQLSREFRPDAVKYNATAQLVAAEYLSSLALYAGGAEMRLQYRMGIFDQQSKLVTVTLGFTLEGHVVHTNLAAHYETYRRSQAVSARIMRTVSNPGKLTSVGDHIVFWQQALHELFRTGIEWELWQYRLASPEETGWVTASA